LNISLWKRRLNISVEEVASAQYKLELTHSRPRNTSFFIAETFSPYIIFVGNLPYTITCPLLSSLQVHLSQEYFEDDSFLGCSAV
jgi:16S rRNA A1518/A1519 N6-dimethyltransferase RsmA/KsgA/DIM1 with predicted DNA glycosylase/AP lyase activity